MNNFVNQESRIKNNGRYRVVAGLAVVIFSLGIGIWHELITTSNTYLVETPLQGVVTISFDFGNGNVITESDIKLKQGATVFSVMREVLEQHATPLVYDPPGDWGVFIRQIGAQRNGQGGRYWQYWVNGVQPQVAADRYIVKNGDTIEWKFISSLM